jgi:hypothetical protein
LQLAAEEGKSFGVVFGHTRNAAAPSPAPLRIQLSAARGRLGLQILKRRGGGWAPPLSLALHAQRAERHVSDTLISREGRGNAARVSSSRLQRVRQGVA